MKYSLLIFTALALAFAIWQNRVYQKSIIDNLSRPYRRCIAILMWISYITAAYFLISELILYWSEHGFNWRVVIKILVSAGWITILYRSITLKNTLAKKLWK